MRSNTVWQVILLSLFVISGVFLVTITNSSTPEKECLIKSAAYERLACLRPYFERLTHAESAEIAVKKAQKLQEDKVIDDCHLAAHFIGEAQYKKHKDSVGRAFATCSMGCLEGCFHGVMETYISNASSSEVIVDMSRVCDEIARNARLRRQCIHGIGHGLMRHNSNLLLQAVNLCKKFKNEATICQGGVFMENMNNYLLIDEKSLEARLPTICIEVEAIKNHDLINACYRAIGEGLMFYTGHDISKSKKMCSNLSKYQDVCMDSAEKQLSTNRRQI